METFKEKQEKRKQAWAVRMAKRALQGLETEEVLWNNEVEANRLVEKIMYVSAAVLLMTDILNVVGIYHLGSGNEIHLLIFSGMAMMLVPALLCRKYQGKKKWLKYLMLISCVLAYGATDCLLGYRAVLTMAIATVLAARYYSVSLVVFIELLTAVVFGFSSALTSYIGDVDLNYVTIAPNTVLTVKDELLNAVMESGVNYDALEESMVLRNYMPKFFLFTIIAIAASGIALRGYRMVVEQAEISKEHARVETELDMASRIQAQALPIVHTLPDNINFDMCASMDPAKEVGGDFYDFFFTDPTHLALMIADVSGKGVPAALFMMVSKLLLDNSLQAGKGPGQVLAEVNHQLCEKGLEDMFVTVWLGLLDLETGKMTTASAGHEFPLICRAGGSFEMFKDKHGLVLGGLDGMRYVESEIDLAPGDTLFVYTDGVPEATNSQLEQYGMDRTIAALDKVRDGNMETLLEGLKADIAQFVGEAEQFDDTTMLAFRLTSYLEQEGISGTPNTASVAKTAEYVEGQMELAGVPMASANKVMIAVDEVYSNIVHYSKATWAQVKCAADEEKVVVEFKDNGIPYNPLQKEDPNLEAIAEGDTLGGLGIFMTKNLMSKVEYSYTGGCNLVTITLELK